MNVPNNHLLYAPTLRYDVLSAGVIDEVVALARKIQRDEVAADGAIDFLNHQDPNAIAWAALKGAELLELDGQRHILSMGGRLLIRTAFAEAMRQKLTDAQIAELMQVRFGYSRDDASVVARTEVRLALGYGSYCGAVSAGMRLKRWLLSNEDGGCEACHANADSGWIQMDAPFASGAQLAIDRVGCRCDTAYSRASSPETASTPQQ